MARNGRFGEVYSRCVDLAGGWKLAGDLLYIICEASKKASMEKSKSGKWVFYDLPGWVQRLDCTVTLIVSLIGELSDHKLIDTRMDVITSQVSLRPSMATIRHLAVADGPWRNVLLHLRFDNEVRPISSGT